MRRSSLASFALVTLTATALPIAMAVAMAGCSAASEAGDEESAEAVSTRTLSVQRLATAADFQSLSIPGGGFPGAGRSGKFFIDRRVTSRPKVYFLNGNHVVGGVTPEYAKFHYPFAQRQLGIDDTNEEFNETTYFSQAKRYVAGTVRTWYRGGSDAPVYGVQFYPDDVIAEATLLDVLRTVKAAIRIPGAKVAFVATGPQQTSATVAAEIARLGIEITSIDAVLGAVKYIGLNEGDAWGYLRIFPTNVGRLGTTDIPVFDELPLDLGVVAGVLTKAVQDVNSHVNLKSKERGTPNAVVRDAGPEHPTLRPWADKPVHLKVTLEGFTLESTTPEVIEQKRRERLDRPWIPLPVVDESRLLSFDEMCPALDASCFAGSPRFGGKATGLAFLSRALGRTDAPGSESARFGYDLTPRGFGLPVQFFREFVNAPENSALKTLVDALVADEKEGRLDAETREVRVRAVKQAFLVAKTPPAILEALKARVAELLPNVPKFKFRSSATSEDIPNFNGAGLYDSFSAEIDKRDNADGSCRVEEETGAGGVVTKAKVKPKTLQCAMKAVFASTFNVRAMEERTFARLDHATAGMGIAVNPDYDIDEEVAYNAVLVTRVLGGEIYGYSVSLQQGNNLVTNPEPGTLTEFDLAVFADPARPPRFTTTRYATTEAGTPVRTSRLLGDDKLTELVDLAKAVEVAMCKAQPNYHPKLRRQEQCDFVWLDLDKPKALDMEFKILESGRYVLKQSREFHGK